MYVGWRSISAADETANDSGCYQKKMLDIHGEEWAFYGLPTLLDDARLVNVCVRVDSCFFLSIEFFTEIHCTIFGNYELKKISGNIWVCGWVLRCLGGFAEFLFCKRFSAEDFFIELSSRSWPAFLFSSTVKLFYGIPHRREPGSVELITNNIMCNLQPVLTFLHHWGGYKQK